MALYIEMGLVRVNIVADAFQRHCILKWDLSGLTLFQMPVNGTVSWNGTFQGWHCSRCLSTPLYIVMGLVRVNIVKGACQKHCILKWDLSGLTWLQMPVNGTVFWMGLVRVNTVKGACKRHCILKRKLSGLTLLQMPVNGTVSWNGTCQGEHCSRGLWTALYLEMGLVRVNIVKGACQKHCILKWDLSGLTLLQMSVNGTVFCNGTCQGEHCSRCLWTALYLEMGLVRVNMVADACQRHCILKWDLSGLTLFQMPFNRIVPWNGNLARLTLFLIPKGNVSFISPYCNTIPKSTLNGCKCNEFFYRLKELGGSVARGGGLLNCLTLTRWVSFLVQN